MPNLVDKIVLPKGYQFKSPVTAAASEIRDLLQEIHRTNPKVNFKQLAEEVSPTTPDSSVRYYLSTKVKGGLKGGDDPTSFQKRDLSFLLNINRSGQPREEAMRAALVDMIQVSQAVKVDENFVLELVKDSFDKAHQEGTASGAIELADYSLSPFYTPEVVNLVFDKVTNPRSDAEAWQVESVLWQIVTLADKNTIKPDTLVEYAERRLSSPIASDSEGERKSRDSSIKSILYIFERALSNKNLELTNSPIFAESVKHYVDLAKREGVLERDLSFDRVYIQSFRDEGILT